MLISLLIAIPQMAAGISVTDKNHATLSGTLIARPKLCMTERKDRSCTMKVELIWQTNQANNFCIYSSQQNALIDCWNNLTAGNKIVPIHATKSINYKLILNNSALPANTEGIDAAVVHANTVASTTVSILSVIHKAAQKNRRRRHAWSLF